jgi:signal transduction histidine kinase
MVRAVAVDDRLHLLDQGESVQIVNSSNHVVAATGVLEGRPPVGPVQKPDAPQVIWTRKLSRTDAPLRVIGSSVSSSRGRLTIYVASSLEATAESVAQVKRDLMISLPVLLALVGVTSWYIVGRALHPVEGIRAQVADISFSGLEKRVPEPAINDEIGRLARTMNAMLDRLQASSDRQRRFVADASHELRSPLATLRTHMEVRQAYTTAGPEETTATASALTEVIRMERLVSDLLLLAKADAHRFLATSGPVPLHEVVLDEVLRQAGEGTIALDVSNVTPATVIGDPEALARVVRNLLLNAVRHATRRVEVGVRAADGQAELTVADDGAGVPADATERIFERFTRLDQARARDNGGSGLGLAIVCEIVQAHGGQVAVNGDGPGAIFTVRLPAAPDT